MDMKHKTIILLVLAFIGASRAMAQSLSPNQCRNLAPAYQRLLLKAETPNIDQQAEQRSTAKQKLQQFWLRTETFIASWSVLASEYNEKGTFNVKKAKQVSKAFHDLEKTEGWTKYLLPKSKSDSPIHLCGLSYSRAARGGTNEKCVVCWQGVYPRRALSRQNH
jgi:hypothetical protein